jgi:hypothetical protein
MFESLLASGMSKSTKNEIFKSLFAAGTAKVRKFSNGGMISGPGSGTSDSILARVSNGEAIIPARSVARNPGMIRQLISGNIPGFNQGFIDEISGRGRNTSTQANISAILSSEIGKIRSRSEMYGYDADRVVEGFIAHIRNSSENIDKLTQANIKAMVRNNPERITYSPNSGQQQTTQFAHVGGNATMTAQEALANLTLSPSKRANLEMVARENSSQPVNVYHGFGFQAKGSVNEQMAKAGADLSEMVDDFGSRGVDKWRDAVKNGGGNFEQLISQATAYDEQVLLRLQQSKAQGVTKIVDTQLQIDNLRQQALAAGKTFDSKQYVIMEQIHDSVITDLKMMGTDLDNVFNSARQTIKDVRYRIPASMHNVPGIFEGTGRGPEKPNVRVMGGNYGTMPTASQATAAGRANGLAFVNAQNAVLDNPANDPAIVSRDSRRRNSPHEQASIDGRDDGIAYNKARSAEVQKASQSGRVAGQGGNRVSSEGNMIFLPGQGYVSEGQLARDEALANAPMQGPKQGNRLQRIRSAMNAESVYRRIQAADQEKLAGGIRNKAFGASGALAIGSMVVPGEAGQAMGMASLLSSFGGMGAGGIAKGLKSLSPNILKLGMQFGKFIPYVGIAIAAFEIFDNVVLPMFKGNAKAFESIANTLSLTQGKLDKINSFFGTDLKLSGIRGSIVASGDQTKTEATIAQQFQQSQEFKDIYEEDAKAMSKLTNEQFKNAMIAMAADLAGQGLEPEGVTAIIDAIAISAGKTRVKVTPEQYMMNTPQSRESINNRIQNTFKESGKNVAALEGQIDSSPMNPFFEDGNVGKAIRGDSITFT